MKSMLSREAEAATILWDCWRGGTRIAQLPESCRPQDRSQAYAVQREVARLSGQATVGWKIAATSAAGQRHIAVDGPLAGRLLSARVMEPGAVVPFAGNAMRVAEAEFAFRMARPLPRRREPYSRSEVLDAVGTLHLAIEAPDSRYENFVVVGAAQLIADTACASWVVIGPPVQDDWRSRDLSAHAVTLLRNGAIAAEGSGANVLGDPLVALTWLANELSQFDQGLKADDVVITGTCVPPAAIEAGDRVSVDFGSLGTVVATFGQE